MMVCFTCLQILFLSTGEANPPTATIISILLHTSAESVHIRARYQPPNRSKLYLGMWSAHGAMQEGFSTISSSPDSTWYLHNQCSQPSRADGRALAGYSPGRPGQGGYGRQGKASVFHKDGSPVG